MNIPPKTENIRSVKNITENISDEDLAILSEINSKIQIILKEIGFDHVDYVMKKHPLKSFTKAKKEINICMDCTEYDDHKLLYTSLHEVAHVITQTNHASQVHDDKWWNNFNLLLDTGEKLGYL